MLSAAAMFDLSKKVVIVTGAGGGFGRAFTQALGAAGASAACLDRDESSVRETTSLTRQDGGVANSYVTDVADETALSGVVARVAETFGRIDILINNAGISARPVRIHELPTEDWDRVMNINLRGTYLCNKAVLPHMMRAGGGSIVNITSITGMVGFYPGISAIGAAYSASKAGMIGFTRQLAAEYAADNIRCNAVAPGFHGGTDLGRERRASASAEDNRFLGEAIVRRTPLQRLGHPEELVGLVLYLASDASRFVTGQVIAHDGGWTAT